MEEWRQIKGFNDMYEVSNLGRVKSNYGNGRILKQYVDKNGYCRITLMQDSMRRHFYVHQLVCFSFMGVLTSRKTDVVVDHIDSNTSNNNLSNLRLITQRENVSIGKKRFNPSSRHTGVYRIVVRSKNGVEYRYFGARIFKDGTIINLGTFKTESEAKSAYDAELIKIKC